MPNPLALEKARDMADTMSAHTAQKTTGLMSSEKSEQCSLSAVMQAHLHFWPYVTNCDLGDDIHNVFWAVRAVIVSAMFPLFYGRTSSVERAFAGSRN